MTVKGAARAVLALASVLPACASARASVDTVAAPAAVVSTIRFQKEYVLTIEDQLDVVVQRSPEVSRSLVIRPDGFISLPLLGDVQAAGLTVRDLAARLTTLFSARLVDPEVTVIATRVRQPVVYVAGEVGNPSAVPLRDAPSAMQAIALAGGFRRTADTNDIAIIRLAADGRLQAIRVPVQVGGQPGPLLALRLAALQPDDLLFVPESGRGQFARFLDDFIARPLGSVNAILGTWVNFRLSERLIQDTTR